MNHVLPNAFDLIIVLPLPFQCVCVCDQMRLFTPFNLLKPNRTLTHNRVKCTCTFADNESNWITVPFRFTHSDKQVYTRYAKRINKKLIYCNRMHNICICIINCIEPLCFHLFRCSFVVITLCTALVAVWCRFDGKNSLFQCDLSCVCMYVCVNVHGVCTFAQKILLQFISVRFVSSRNVKS